MSRAGGAVPARSRLPFLSAAVWLSVAWGFALAQTPPAPDAPASGGRPLSFAQAVERALASNRELAAARIGREVSRARVRVAGERPNPDLSVEASRDLPHESAMLSLPIELGGKRSRRVDVAEAEAREQDAEIAKLELALRIDVRRAYYGLVAAQRNALDALARRDMASRIDKAAADRVEAGDAARLESLRTALDLASAEQELDLAEAERDAAAARLGILLASAPGETIEPVEPVETMVPPSPMQPNASPPASGAGATPVIVPGDLVDKALAGSPEIAALQRAVEAAEARVALARSERVPDPVLSAGVDHDAPPDFVWGWRAGLGLTLPLFTTHRAGVVVAERELARSTAERDALSARLAAQIGSAASLVAARAESVRRFRETMQPRAAEIQELAEEAYRAGQSDLAELFQELGAARDIRARGVQAELDLQLAIADLEDASGVPLP